MMSRLELAEIARRMSWPMRVAVASPALFVVALIALSVRGASDWSYAVAGFWYALALPAVLLGLIGLLLSAFARGIRPSVWQSSRSRYPRRPARPGLSARSPNSRT